MLRIEYCYILLSLPVITTLTFSQTEVGPIHEKHIVTPYSTVYNHLNGLTVQSLFRKECRLHASNDYLGVRKAINGSDSRVFFNLFFYNESSISRENIHLSHIKKGMNLSLHLDPD